LGHQQPSYRRKVDRLECEVIQPLVHAPGEGLDPARSGRPIQ
jgi:hypothetical protein